MKLIGSIVTSDGTSKNNNSTAVAFAIPSKLLIQSSVDVYVTTGSVNTVAATTSDLKIPADSIVELSMAGDAYLAMIPVNGTAATLKVWAL